MSNDPIALVQRSTGSFYTLLTDEGEILEARLKGKLRLAGFTDNNPIAVGDRVRYRRVGVDTNITALEPRRNYMVRRSNNLSRKSQVIASNLDQVLILASLALPRTSFGFVDRLLATAEAYSIDAQVIINKKDLYKKEGLDLAQEWIELYTPLGYPCSLISAKDPQDIKGLQDYLANKTVLVTGHSGVGKSTLLNALSPGLDQKTARISTSSMKGMHTTTFAQMFMLDNGAKVIDTPGIKDFGLVHLLKEELGHYFPEIRDRMSGCKYTNCLHDNEPNCAIKAAVEAGEVAQSRYLSYLSMLHEENTHS